MENQPEKESLKRDMTAAEGAALLNVAPQSIRNAVTRGELEAAVESYPYGQGTRQRLRFSRHELEAWHLRYIVGDASLPEGVEDRWINAYQAARITGLTPRMMNEAARRGWLPSRRHLHGEVRSTYDFRLSDVVQWRRKRGSGGRNRRKELALNLELVA